VIPAVTKDIEVDVVAVLLLLPISDLFVTFAEPILSHLLGVMGVVDDCALRRRVRVVSICST
jgi:hypothetical protein